MMPEHEQSIDMILVLSSEIVCEIAEAYFNTKMLRKGSQVKVIDLKATEGGLVQFNVEFVKEEVPKQEATIQCEGCGFFLPRSLFHQTDDNLLALKCDNCMKFGQSMRRSIASTKEESRAQHELVSNAVNSAAANAYLSQEMQDAMNGKRDAKGRFVKVK